MSIENIIVCSSEDMRDARSFRNARMSNSIFVSQCIVRPVVCYGIRRCQNATASGPAIADVFGMAVIRISVVAVIIGVVVAVNTGSTREAIVE